MNAPFRPSNFFNLDNRMTVVLFAGMGGGCDGLEEGAAAHGFAKGSLPDTINLDGKEVRLTKTQKYHLVGNSVPPKMIRLLAEHNVRREFAEAAE